MPLNFLHKFLIHPIVTTNKHFSCSIELYRKILNQKEVILVNFKKIKFPENHIYNKRRMILFTLNHTAA